MKNEQIGRMLRYYRTLRKLSVQTVSDKLKDANLPSATKTIYAWEAGRTQPDADRLLYLCKLYEIDDTPGSSVRSQQTVGIRLNLS